MQESLSTARQTRALISASISGVIQFSIAMSSYIFLMRIVSAYGSNAAAGFTIAIRIFSFTYLPAWRLGNAVTTLVGQNLGAGRPDRAERSAWMGPLGVYISIAFADGLLAVGAVVVFRRGRWKLRKV